MSQVSGLDCLWYCSCSFGLHDDFNFYLVSLLACSPFLFVFLAILALKMVILAL